MLKDISIGDWIAMAAFFASWFGYSTYADTLAHGRRPVAVVMNDYRLRWMERMLERENRMPDVNITASFVRTAMMFASTSTLLLAGALAMLGQLEHVRNVIGGLAFARPAPQLLTEVQLLILTAVFVFAFFKFIWAIRLFNNMAVLLGAAPHAPDCDEAIREAYPQHMARFVNRAFLNLNNGTRAYAFGLGLLPWFLHPYLLFISMAAVIAVLHRRDFRSASLQALNDLTEHH